MQEGLPISLVVLVVSIVLGVMAFFGWIMTTILTAGLK